MTTKSLLAIGVLLLAGSSMAFAKSYEVVLGTTVQAGNVSLQPGSYRITHKRDDAVFTNLRTDKVYRTPATVEALAAKNPKTKVDIADVNGVQRIQTVELGGRSMDLQLGD